MKAVFWIVYIVTIAEFTASPVNVLRGSAMHLQRFREVKFPLGFAKGLAWAELLAAGGIIAGLWVHLARLIGGIVLAISFVILLPWALRAKRPLGDILGLVFFIACALVVALY